MLTGMLVNPGSPEQFFYILGAVVLLTIIGVVQRTYMKLKNMEYNLKTLQLEDDEDINIVESKKGKQSNVN